MFEPQNTALLNRKKKFKHKKAQKKSLPFDPDV